MNDKPIYPFAPGQMFENLVYRSIKGEDYNRKRFIKDSLSLRNSKYFFIENIINVMSICDRPYTDYSGYRKRFNSHFCGYPIHQEITNKIFEKTKPAGHWFSHFDDMIIKAMRNIPLIPFLVTKNTKSLSGNSLTLPKGGYFSVGNISSGIEDGPRLVGSRIIPQFSAVQIEENGQKMYESHSCYWDTARFSAHNIFIPSGAFSNEDSVGLVILPNMSLVWLWHDGKWKPCQVKTTPDNKKKTKVSTKFIEIDTNPDGTIKEKLCLLELCNKEFVNHKSIQKLIDKDELRIAVRSLTKIECNSNVIHPRSQLIGMLAKNFNSEFLEPYKMSLLKSTDCKNMTTFNEFAIALVKKFPPLSASFLHPGSIIPLAEFVVLAAKEGTPLFWGLDPLLKSHLFSNLEKIFGYAGFCMNNGPVSNSYHIYQYGINHKDIKHNLNKKIKVIFNASVEKKVIEYSTVKPKHDVEVEIPNFILAKGDKFVKSYIKDMFNDIKSNYQLSEYETIGEKSYTKTGNHSDVKFSVNLDTIAIQ